MGTSYPSRGGLHRPEGTGQEPSASPESAEEAHRPEKGQDEPESQTDEQAALAVKALGVEDTERFAVTEGLAWPG